MKTIIRNHPATSQEAIQFTQHLLQSFPITTRRQITIEFRSTNSIGRGNWGMAHDYKFNNTLFLELALGTSKERRDLQDLLHTIAHEYCHALQHDQEKPASCTEADLFGDKEVPKFLEENLRMKKAA